MAMRVAVGLIEALHYKLRMFGIPLEGSTSVFCDNQGVVNNSSTPESTLNKKHNAICYHRVREAAASGMIRVAKEDGATNLADCLTKTIGDDEEETFTMFNMLLGAGFPLVINRLGTGTSWTLLLQRRQDQTRGIGLRGLREFGCH